MTDDSVEIGEALAAYPGLEDYHLAPIVGGLVHRSFSVRCRDAEYVLQRVSSIFSPRIHENIVAVTEHLQKQGIPTLLVVPTRTHEPYVDLGAGGTWRLVTRVPGATRDECSSPAQARSAGALVARFHSALVDLEHDFHPLGFRFHDTPVYLEELRAALVTHRSHRLYGVVAAIAEEVLAAADAWEPLGVLPQWVIHGDLKFNNVLFAEPGPDDEARALSLIDLDTLSRSPLWVELGDAWRSWCNRAGEDSPEADLDMAFFRASAEGYLGELSIDLTAPERASLVHGIERISLELCVRFAADALNESYFGWDAESFESAGDHNLTRARGQLSLYRQTCATREERAEILG